MWQGLAVLRQESKECLTQGAVPNCCVCLHWCHFKRFSFYDICHVSSEQDLHPLKVSIGKFFDCAPNIGPLIHPLSCGCCFAGGSPSQTPGIP